MRVHQTGCVIDAGANEGQFARDLRTDGYRSRIVSFEPGTAAFAALKRHADHDPMWEIHNVALSDTAITAELHLLGDATNVASLHAPVREQVEHFDFLSGEARTEQVSCVRLDQLALDLGDRVLLKVDTQGHDLAVLRGATGMLGAVTIIQTELSFEALYEGQTPWREMVDHLDGLGFVPAGFFPVVRDGEWSLVEADGVFVRHGIIA